MVWGVKEGTTPLLQVQERSGAVQQLQAGDSVLMQLGQAWCCAAEDAPGDRDCWDMVALTLLLPEQLAEQHHGGLALQPSLWRAHPAGTARSLGGHVLQGGLCVLGAIYASLVKLQVDVCRVHCALWKALLQQGAPC